MAGELGRSAKVWELLMWKDERVMRLWGTQEMRTEGDRSETGQAWSWAHRDGSDPLSSMSRVSRGGLCLEVGFSPSVQNLRHWCDIRCVEPSLAAGSKFYEAR